jgi:hypothetical protein
LIEIIGELNELKNYFEDGKTCLGRRVGAEVP